MIGNDSGIGHLASNLKIPTLTIFASRRKKTLWRCDFFQNDIIYPLPLINIKGFRIRDKYWYKTIFVFNILKKFNKLTKNYL
jgi:ADP-heptose:LPS heptosyltransferase